MGNKTVYDVYEDTTKEGLADSKYRYGNRDRFIKELESEENTFKSLGFKIKGWIMCKENLSDTAPVLDGQPAWYFVKILSSDNISYYGIFINSYGTYYTTEQLETLINSVGE